MTQYEKRMSGEYNTHMTHWIQGVEKKAAENLLANSDEMSKMEYD